MRSLRPSLYRDRHPGLDQLWERLGPAPVLANWPDRARDAGGARRRRDQDGERLVRGRLSRSAAGVAPSTCSAGCTPTWPRFGRLLVRDRRPRVERCGERSDGPLAWAGPAAAVSTAVAAAAHGGQVLLTGPARAAAGDALADSALADLGEHLLPGAPRPLPLPRPRFPPAHPGAR